jgi:nucleoside-diphosphate-sugar epimerase
MVRIVLTGASGMLGRELYTQLCAEYAGPDNCVIGWCGSRNTNNKWKQIDLTSAKAIETGLMEANVSFY